jgi:hypothetical protein
MQPSALSARQMRMRAVALDVGSETISRSHDRLGESM